MRILYHMPVNLKRGARIGMTELSLNYFRRRSGVEQKCRV